MSRPVGIPKTGGRKKGSVNKDSKFLKEVLISNDFNIVENLLELLPEIEPNKRADILVKLLDYVFVKPRNNPQDSMVQDERGFNHSFLMKCIEQRKK